MGLREKWMKSQEMEELLTSQAETTLDGFETRDFMLGEYIFKAGDPSREMYLILSGQVLVYQERDTGIVEIAELRSPEFLGEMGALQGTPRSTNALAKEFTRVLVIPEGEIDRAIRTMPRWFISLVDTLITRLRATDQRLIEDCRLDAIRKSAP